MSNKKFPTYNAQRKTGDRGVTFVRSIIENQFDWVFRPMHLEEDFGLDGYLDIIGVENSVTGKYLGVQIKTGDSYFKTETSVGWKFIGENKHLNYFLNLDFPVLIILVNLNLQEAFWVEFDINRTEKTGTGWSIVVPKENRLDLSSKNNIQQLAGDVIDYMSQIEYQWEINEQIKESALVFLNVSKEEILKQDVIGFIDLLDRLTLNDDMIKKARGKISFVIDGYNDDVREVYEIPEIRLWTKKVLPAFKYWGYFLNMQSYIEKRSGLKMLHFCTVDVKVVKIDNQSKRKFVEYDKDQTVAFLYQIFGWLNEFTEKYSIPLEINKEQSDLIGNLIFGINAKDSKM